MKKIFNLFATMLAVVILFSACTKSTDKILTRKDGKWNLEIIYQEYLDGTEVDTDLTKGTMTFSKDDFTMTFLGGGVETGKWTATDDKIILTSNGFGVSFDILESKKNSQVWEHIYTETDDDTGEVTIEKNTFKLTR